MSNDKELRVHRDWISTMQPVGLLVSPPALAAAQAVPQTNIFKQQQALIALAQPKDTPESTPKYRAASRTTPAKQRSIPSFPLFAYHVLGWKPKHIAGAPEGEGPPLPESLSYVLADFNETLRPTYAVPSPKGDTAPFQLLIQELPPGTPMDKTPDHKTHGWQVSPQARLERLLRETDIPTGILFNAHALRLVYAPRGESSGHITWPIHLLFEVSGREMLSALCMLLGAPTLFTKPREQRLPHILRESRKYQSVVSTQLAAQVLEALNELLRGFQSANEATQGQLLDTTAREDPDHIYGGLLAVLLRLVFLLYAEERGLLSETPLYVRNYSLVGLFDQLRADSGRYPDTMDQRFGAWSRLLVLFRIIFKGAAHGTILNLPPRHGHLFDPDIWSFLEGRPYKIPHNPHERLQTPRISDGVVYRVLSKLLLLDGDRLSYRALDVEQIGSVYENMMGFRLERATELSIGVGKDHVVVGLESLLSKKGAERQTALKEGAGVDLSGKAGDALKQAKTVDDVVAALGKRISPLTPRVVPVMGLYLQPTDERRRSGSHYTPRELTEPIVKTALDPVLSRLGSSPRPGDLLALKVCDPAMGSGAFLVAACRYMGDVLMKAYEAHGRPADAREDEDLALYARREVAQRCLYGIDKNVFAVDLGKLSLWLATLAKDHAFTFLDHALRHGDSLVGLGREQIASFHWAPEKQRPLIRTVIDKALTEALSLRLRIQAMAGVDAVDEKRDLLDRADAALEKVRRVGDCVVGSFFGSEKAKGREDARKGWGDKVEAWLDNGRNASEIAGFCEDLRHGERGVPCFHWEIEFPEVFGIGVGGFDVMVGNPPFAGKNTLINGNRAGYLDWLKETHAESHGNADLVAHFYRRAFHLIRPGGVFGLIATNTIAQGDTRSTGLRYICMHGGEIFSARRRYKWPGLAAVVVSVVHVMKGGFEGKRLLDEREVDRITAYLFHGGGHESPKVLKANEGKSFIGSYVLGMGFTFDDSNEDATPIAEMHRLIAKNPKNQERIFPYIGGEEVNTSPTHSHHRYVIHFGDMSEKEAREGWPDLMAIVEAKVKPERMKLGDNADAKRRKERWWMWGRDTPALWAAIQGLERVLVNSQVSAHLAFAFQPADRVFAHTLNIFVIPTYAAFALLQSRIHETWARFFASSLEDRLRYTPSDCFETFPFPPDWQTIKNLERAGQAYYQHRAALMIQNNQGLTKTYNRFHDPDEDDPGILQLRQLHASMDTEVLHAYGWTDITPTYDFLLDYEDEASPEPAALPQAKTKGGKKPWRYRFTDDLRDEILARLLEQNTKLAQAEAAQASRPAVSEPVAPKRAAPKAKKGGKGQGQLF